MILAGVVALIIAGGCFYLVGFNPSMPILYYVSLTAAIVGVFFVGWGFVKLLSV